MKVFGIFFNVSTAEEFKDFHEVTTRLCKNLETEGYASTEIKENLITKSFEQVINRSSKVETFQKNYKLVTQTKRLHIAVVRRPFPYHQLYTISTEDDQILFEGETFFGDETYFQNVLKDLRHQSLIPEVIYVEPFCHIVNDIKSVWPSVKVLMEYW